MQKGCADDTAHPFLLLEGEGIKNYLNFRPYII